MKLKNILVLLLSLSVVSAFAQHRHYGHHHHGHHNNYNWVAPMIIGGVIGYELSRPQPPVIVQQPPIILQPSEPSELVNINGILYRKTYTNINGVWQEVLIRY
jgi:hypothetical protein